MCPAGQICIAEGLYYLVLIGLMACICIIASILSPPLKPISDEEQKARQEKLRPKKEKDDGKGNDTKPGPPAAAG